LNLDIRIYLEFSVLSLEFPCRVSLRAEGVAIPGEGKAQKSKGKMRRAKIIQESKVKVQNGEGLLHFDL